MILDQLDQNKFSNRHFLPQYFFLGTNLSYYNFYADIKKINLFINFINNFFEKKIDFPKLQTGGKEFDINLTTKQKKRIKAIYHKDFEIFNFKS